MEMRVASEISVGGQEPLNLLGILNSNPSSPTPTPPPPQVGSPIVYRMTENEFGSTFKLLPQTSQLRELQTIIRDRFDQSRRVNDHLSIN